MTNKEMIEYFEKAKERYKKSLEKVITNNEAFFYETKIDCYEEFLKILKENEK